MNKCLDGVFFNSRGSHSLHRRSCRRRHLLGFLVLEDRTLVALGRALQGDKQEGVDWPNRVVEAAVEFRERLANLGDKR